MWIYHMPSPSFLSLFSLFPPKTQLQMGLETLQNRQARVALKESCAHCDAYAHGTCTRPWPNSQCACERLVRVCVIGWDYFFGFLCFSPFVCFLPCSFDPCLAYFNPGITSKHIKASYGIKKELEFIKIRLKKHVFTLKHKYERDYKIMLILRLNARKGRQNTLNSIQDKPSNWGLSQT